MTKEKHNDITKQKNIPSDNPDDRKLLDWLESSLKEKEEISGYSLQKLFSRLTIHEDNFPGQLQKDMWDKISTECHSEKKKSFHLYKRIFGYAAAILICILSIPFIYLTIQKTEYTADIFDYQSILQDLPEHFDSNNITLILPDNETIEITENDVDLIHDEKGEIIVNGKNEKAKTVDSSAPQWLQLNVPHGKSTHITLSDGTKVWVNSGSRLLYPAHFAENKRELYVEGEIFLDVAKNKAVPFLIKTDAMEITVVGTSFNVNAYKNAAEQSVVLASGKVSIKSISGKEKKTLLPSQKYSLDKETAISKLEVVDINAYISWKEGYLHLKDEPLAYLINRIERYYNIQIEHEPQSTQKILVSGKLDLKETPEALLDIISVTTPITYISNESTIKINVNPLKN